MASTPKMEPATARARVQAAYAALPLAFEKNQGQTDERVKYIARTRGYTLFLTASDAVLALQSGGGSAGRANLRGKSQAAQAVGGKATGKNNEDGRDAKTAVVDMKLVGANPAPKIFAGSELPGKSNYFIGNDPKRWQSNVPQFARVSYEEVYPGVNLAFHGGERQLEFDFVVAANADTRPIAFHLSGAKTIETDRSGDLVISSAAGDVRFHKPVAYQQVNGKRRAVDAGFILSADNNVGFQLGNYDHSRELVIDPSVSVAYATYLGGNNVSAAEAITIDGSGNAYVTGQTTSTNFPGSPTRTSSSQTAFVTEINPTGSTLVYSTYLGGTVSDGAFGIALDKSGDAFVVGATESGDFPVMGGAYQSTLASGATNAFIAELNTSGTLTYATFFGGSISDSALGIAFDKATGVYAVVGAASSTNFPTKNAKQTALNGGSNGFVSLWNSSGNTLTFSTYLGAATADLVNSVALDASDNVYVTGKTSGSSFPTTSGAFQTTCGTGGGCNGGLSDAFVTVYNAAGSQYLYSTFLGGSNGDVGDGIAVDATGVYVTGVTESNTDFPVVSGGFQTAFGGGVNDAFVSKLNLTLSKLLYSSYLGGSGPETGASIAVDSGGNAYVTGQTESSGPSPFTGPNATQSALSGGYDAFVTEINPAGTKVLFSTYLGGTADEDDGGNFGAIAVNSFGGDIYVAGNTQSITSFPVTSGAYQTASSGATEDAFVASYSQPSFSMSAPAPAAVTPGGSATIGVTLTSLNGYTSPVNLSCTVTGAGSPLPQCGTFSVNPVTPTPTGAASNLTVTTTGLPTGALLHPRKFQYALWLPGIGLSVVGIVFSTSRSRRKALVLFVMIGVVSCGLLFLPACGSSNNTTTGGGCTTKPSVPTGLAASSVGSTTATLSWTAATAGTGCTVSSYTVYQNGTSIGTSTSTTFNVTGLTAGTKYSFTVAASDSAGSSAQSSALSVTTTTSGATPAGTYTVTITGVGTDANATTESVATTVTVN